MSCSALSMASALRERYASAIAPRRSLKLGRPKRGSSGKYVPRKYGRASGKQNADSGQPPPFFMTMIAFM